MAADRGSADPQRFAEPVRSDDTVRCASFHVLRLVFDTAAIRGQSNSDEQGQRNAS